jgi:hypothetical protein
LGGFLGKNLLSAYKGGYENRVIELSSSRLDERAFPVTDENSIQIFYKENVK